MVKAYIENKTEAKAKDLDPSEIKVAKNETELRWFVWKEKFIINLTNKFGVIGTPIIYVIHEDRTSG